MSGISVRQYRPEFALEFRRLNLEWIEQLFSVEEPDRRVLDEPGRCELAEMAVATPHRRRGVGERLGRACIEWARDNGIRTVHLETNSRLDGAIRLYERLGFRHAKAHASDYARADVFMELAINESEAR